MSFRPIGSKLKQFTVGYFASVGGITAGTLYYLKDIKNIKELQKQHLHFDQLILSNPAQLYQRDVKTAKNMQDLVKILFSQPFYQLELMISGKEFKENEFEYKVGTQIGHMKLEATYDDECVFRYLFEGFNYRLYLKKDDDCLKMGFVEYSGSWLEEIGCRLYVPLLLEGLAKRA